MGSVAVNQSGHAVFMKGENSKIMERNKQRTLVIALMLLTVMLLSACGRTEPSIEASPTDSSQDMSLDDPDAVNELDDIFANLEIRTDEEWEEDHREYEEARERMLNEPQEGTFHDISYIAPAGSVGREISEVQRNIAIDGKMMQLMFVEAGKDMTDAKMTAEKYAERQNGEIIEFSETTVDGVYASCLTYKAGDTTRRAYIFTVNKNGYAIDGNDAEIVDTFAKDVKIIR